MFDVFLERVSHRLVHHYEFRLQIWVSFSPHCGLLRHQNYAFFLKKAFNICVFNIQVNGLTWRGKDFKKKTKGECRVWNWSLQSMKTVVPMTKKTEIKHFKVECGRQILNFFIQRSTACLKLFYIQHIFET